MIDLQSIHKLTKDEDLQNSIVIHLLTNPHVSLLKAFSDILEERQEQERIQSAIRRNDYMDIEPLMALFDECERELVAFILLGFDEYRIAKMMDIDICVVRCGITVLGYKMENRNGTEESI